MHKWDLKRKMLLQKYQPPIYQIPNHLSQPLKVVLDYLDNVKRWGFDALRAIHIAFYPQILPAFLHLSPRTKSEFSYLAGLIEWHSPRGVFPPGLWFRPRFGRAGYHVSILRESTQKNVKAVNFEGIFNLTFGIGKDKNLIVNLTEYRQQNIHWW